MRIGLVIYGALDTISGGYLYDRKLVEHLRRAGDKVEIISLPCRNYARHLTDNLSADLFRRLRDARVDVMLQDELNHPSLLWSNRRLHGRVGYSTLSIVHHLRSSETHPTLQKFFYRWIERQYLLSVDGFVFNSLTTRKVVRQMLGHAPPNSVVALPAGDRFYPHIEPAAIAARTRQPGALRIVFVGNLIPRKGLHTLIDALARLPIDMVQLTVVGDPNIDAKYTAAIRRQIADQRLRQVRLVGALQDHALANVLAQSHVIVVPSDYEGYGIVYLEGMSFGLPAIATTSGAAGEIIDEGVTGFLVAPKDAVMIAERIEMLSRDRSRLAQMGQSACKRFLSHPRWDESMARIRQHLVEICHGI